MKFVDLNRQYDSLKSQIDREIADVINSSSFIMGSKVTEIENTLAQFVGVKHAVSCGSGTDALLLSLLACDIQPGDEVITSPFSFYAAAECISFLKATPVFVDIDPQTFNIDDDQLETAITKKTKGIIPVDLFGQCAEYDRINTLAQDHSLFVIEDAAQAFGAEYKGKKACSLADMACTSFFPAKPLGCFGDGGMIFTDDDARAAFLKSMRSHGMGKNKYDHIHIGLNSRLDTIQAAVLLGKFPNFSKEIERRNQIAAQYTDKLDSAIQTPVVLPHNLSAFAQYSIRVPERPKVQEALEKAGIPTAIHYPKPLHLQEAFKALRHKPGDFPVSEAVCQDILAIPIHPYLTDDEQTTIINKINSALA